MYDLDFDCVLFYGIQEVERGRSQFFTVMMVNEIKNLENSLGKFLEFSFYGYVGYFY